jgi:hypothetical protein
VKGKGKGVGLKPGSKEVATCFGKSFGNSFRGPEVLE